MTAYNRTAEQLRTLVGQVNQNASSVAAASKQMATASEEAGAAVNDIATSVGDVAHGAERQLRMVESTKQSVADTATAANTSAGQAQQAADVAEQTRSVTRDGVGAADHATAAMRVVYESALSANETISHLATKSEQIGGIIQTITGLAEQTNLLALNAAIEAARAGEHGRGFAVVAEEVRKLAEGSSNAASEIAALIGQIQSETQKAVEAVSAGAKRTEDGVATVEQTRQAFERIEAGIEDMTARVGHITASVRGIADGAGRMQSEIDDVALVAEQSSASSEQVSASAQQTSASAQQIAASARELATTAEQLERLVGQFKLTV
jgi:methyl-accepting chemotaxis protein